MCIVTPCSFYKDRRKNTECFQEVLKPLKSFLLRKQKSNEGVRSVLTAPSAGGPEQGSDSSHVKLNYIPCSCLGLFLLRCRTWRFLWSFMMFLPACFSSLSRSLWVAARPSGVSATPARKETLQERQASWWVVAPPLLGPLAGQTTATAWWQSVPEFGLHPCARGKN